MKFDEIERIITNDNIALNIPIEIFIKILNLFSFMDLSFVKVKKIIQIDQNSILKIIIIA